HHPDVLQIVLTEFQQVVREALTLREELLVAAHTGIESVAPRINHARVRQDQANKADVCEVVWHLVDEARRPAPVASRMVKVASAERGPLALRQVAQCLRVLAAPLPMSDELDDAPQGGQLVRALDHAVAREYLLYQRRPRARQSDDENGR